MNKLLLSLIISILILGNITFQTQGIQTTDLVRNSTIIVDNEGDGDFLNIKAALANANEGDIIQIYSGTYQENIKISTNNLSIIGYDHELGTGNDSNFPIIDGNNNGNVIEIYAQNTAIKHCIIQNSGSDLFDAGISITTNTNRIEENGIIGNHYGITLNNCSDNTIQSNYILANTMDGIYLFYTWNNNIINNIIKENNFQGIFIYDTSSSTIQGNTIFLNEKDGIHLRNYCKYNTICDNTIHSNNIDGIKIMESDIHDNKITKNSIYSNGWNGLHVMDGNNNEISENEISLNHFNGIHLGETNNNLIIRNTIQDNKEEGIVILFPSAQGTKIYYNNIINDNVFDNGQNTWDNGKTTGGNYWSYYNGEDEDNDGIGDTAYIIPGNGNIDRYPLINPQYPPDTPAKPSGATIGIIENYYTYKTSSSDTQFNSIQYGWDWNGDNQVDEWTDFYNPNQLCKITHVWNEEGTYNIKVKAMDNYGFQSNWSEPLSISMPKQYDYNNGLFMRFLQSHFPILSNLITIIIHINQALMGYNLGKII